MATATPDFVDAYHTDPADGIVKRYTLHAIDAYDNVHRFPDEWSLFPPDDGKFAVIRTPQYAATHSADETKRHNETLKRQEEYNRADAERNAQSRQSAADQQRAEMGSFSGRNDERDAAVRAFAKRQGLDPTRPDLHEDAYHTYEREKMVDERAEAAKGFDNNRPKDAVHEAQAAEEVDWRKRNTGKQPEREAPSDQGQSQDDKANNPLDKNLGTDLKKKKGEV